MERLTNSTLFAVLIPWRQLLLVGFATMLLSSKSEKICPPKVQGFVHFTDVAYTNTNSVNGYLDACRFGGIPQSVSYDSVERLLMRVVQGNARQRYLDHFLIELTLIDSSVT